jgi:hypothetical protein
MSTNKSKRLNQLLLQQQEILDDLKEEAKAIDNDSLVEENERLSSELELKSKETAALKAQTQQLQKELDSTKNALFSKMANEKLSAFKHTQQKIESIYYSKSNDVGNRLAEYEQGCQKSINQTISVIESYGSSQYDDIMVKLRELETELKHRHAEVDKFTCEQINAAMTTNNAIGKTLKTEPLTESEKQAGLKQKSLETFVGLNILSKAGILLFLVGIVMLGRFAYVHMSDLFKGGLIYALGVLLVAVGELFYKKEKTVFSTALISGGVAVLYAATATCYFALGLYSIKAAFVVCMFITVCAIILSQQIKSEVVCGFAAVGGYLPVVAVFMMIFGKITGFGKAASDITFLPVASIYFCLLGVIIFVMTYNKRWYVAQYIGYALHIIAIGSIARCAWSLKDLSGYDFVLPLAAGFAIASFLVYLLMPSAKIFKRTPLGTADVVLLGINTVIGAISVSITINNCFSNSESGNKAVGIVFFAFTAIYLVLMVCSGKEKSQPSVNANIITSISALVFSMLVVPFVFGIQYAAIAWAIEGVSLAVVSIEKQNTATQIAGAICMILSVICAVKTSEQLGFDNYSVLAIVTLAVIIAAFWIYAASGILAGRERDNLNYVYIIVQIASTIATFGFLCYLYKCAVHGPLVNCYSDFTDNAVMTVFALVLAIVVRHGPLKNTVASIFGEIVGAVLPFVTFGAVDLSFKYNDIYGYYGKAISNKGFEIFNLILLVAINVAVALFFAKVIGSLLNRAGMPMWIYTAAISVVSLMLITVTVMSQFNVSFSNVIISALYIIAACILLVVGFKKNYTVVRSGGLVLILCAFAKLCFVDTSHLDSAWKIASYFAFGALLIVISYFYQRFAKKLESESQE